MMNLVRSQSASGFLVSRYASTGLPPPGGGSPSLEVTA